VKLKPYRSWNISTRD